MAATSAVAFVAVGDTLTIRSLELVNFRSFAGARLDLDDRLTVLVADNGGGKTAALDGLSIALAASLPGVRGRRRKDAPPQRGLDIAPSDAHTSEVLPPYAFAAFPVQLVCEADIRGERLTWTTALNGADSPPAADTPANVVRLAGPAALKERPPVDLPVVAYYGTARATGSLSSLKIPNLGRIERGLGYRNALSPDAN